MPSLGGADAKDPPARANTEYPNMEHLILVPRRRDLSASLPSEGIYALVTYALVTYALVTYALVTYALVE